MQGKKLKKKLSELNKDTDKFEILIPSAIFYDRSVSVLESLVEYLKQAYRLSYHKIAVLTNRDERNIWTIYHRASIKRAERKFIAEKRPNFFIPLSVVKDRSLSILEVLVSYLKQNTSFTNHQIALLLNRSDKTIWTVYNRAKKKNA